MYIFNHGVHIVNRYEQTIIHERNRINRLKLYILSKQKTDILSKKSKNDILNK